MENQKKILTRVQLINWHYFENERIAFHGSTLISGYGGKIYHTGCDPACADNKYAQVQYSGKRKGKPESQGICAVQNGKCRGDVSQEKYGTS